MLQQQTASDSILKDMIRSKQSALYSISRITAYMLLVQLGVFQNWLAIKSNIFDLGKTLVFR